MNKQIGFIGLGNLGRPVAGNLVDAGYTLRVYNRTSHKADSLVARGACRATAPADAIPAGGVVATLLWDGAALEQVVASKGFLEQLAPGGIHISMSTVAPATARKLAAMHADNDSIYIDAPIFGRPDAAVAGNLRFPIAGPQAAKDRVRPILQAMGAQAIFDFGEQVGAATIVKLIGNFLIVSAGYAMREALTVAQETGIDSEPVVDMLASTLFPGPIYSGYGRMVVEGKHPFGDSEIPLKDVGLLKAAGQQAHCQTPMSAFFYSLLSDTMK